METDDRTLDGNAAGGLLAAIFPYEMTSVLVACSGCGKERPAAALRVYASTMGTVIRCPGCDTVLIRVTQIHSQYWLDLSGARRLRIPAA